MHQFCTTYNFYHLQNTIFGLCFLKQSIKTKTTICTLNYVKLHSFKKTKEDTPSLGGEHKNKLKNQAICWVNITQAK